MKFSEPRKNMQQHEQEKFGVKVQSHDTIYFLSGFSFQHAFVKDISTSVGFLYPSHSLRRIVL
jgi:hypothetical protein